MKQIAIVIQVNDGYETTADNRVEDFTESIMAQGIAASVQTEEWPDWFPHEVVRKKGCRR